MQGWGITVLRVVIGALFSMAGMQKLLGILVVRNASQPDSPLPIPIVVVGSLVELLCGAALVIGLRTRWVSLPLALLMLTNVLLVHPPHGPLVEDTKFEYALLRLAAAVTVAAVGPGRMAIDNVLGSGRGSR